MWGSTREKQEETPPGLVAVAIDKDKASQFALKWALDNLLTRGQTVILLHVNNKVHSNQIQDANQQLESGKEIFFPFRCFCTRKDVHCKDVILEEMEIAKAIIENLSQNSIENIVLGASSQNALVKRFKGVHVPSNVSKGAPDFCCVNIISKGKLISQRSATRPAPSVSPLRAQINNQYSIRNDLQTRSPSMPKDSSFSYHWNIANKLVNWKAYSTDYQPRIKVDQKNHPDFSFRISEKKNRKK